MQILLVDDDEDIREVVGLILQAQGHQVVEAVDGLDALARLKEGARPAVILLDLMMPRLDGEGFLRTIRGEPRLAAIPVWIISGHPSARRIAGELGAAGALIKPIDLEQILAVLYQAASGQEARA